MMKYPTSYSFLSTQFWSCFFDSLARYIGEYRMCSATIESFLVISAAILIDIKGNVITLDAPNRVLSFALMRRISLLNLSLLFQAFLVGASHSGNQRRRQLHSIVYLPSLVHLFDYSTFLATFDQLESLWHAMTTAKLEIQIPRFELTTDYQMKPVLQNLGIAAAFTDLADFTLRGASNPDEVIFLKRVDHQTDFKVAERGTKAAAATILRPNILSNPISINLNRPFIFELRIWQPIKSFSLEKLNILMEM